MANRAAAVFLDKDGTLIQNIPDNVDPRLVALSQGAAALKSLQDAGYRLVLASNQAGVAHGKFAEDALRHVERRLRELLDPLGVRLDATYWCPHHPDGVVSQYATRCECRKPAPGMLRRASADLDIDLSRSWMIGDILDDVEAGRRAGCRAILIDNGNETEWLDGPLRRPHAYVSNLSEAADFILKSARIAV